jgi:hypothetical protein
MSHGPRDWMSPHSLAFRNSWAPAPATTSNRLIVQQDWDRCVRNREITAAPDRSGMPRSGTDQNTRLRRRGPASDSGCGRFITLVRRRWAIRSQVEPGHARAMTRSKTHCTQLRRTFPREPS